MLEMELELAEAAVAANISFKLMLLPWLAAAATAASMELKVLVSMLAMFGRPLLLLLLLFDEDDCDEWFCFWFMNFMLSCSMFSMSDRDEFDEDIPPPLA